jgi:hypothetical protein
MLNDFHYPMLQLLLLNNSKYYQSDNGLYDCLMIQDILIYEIELDEYHYLQKAIRKDFQSKLNFMSSNFIQISS